MRSLLIAAKCFLQPISKLTKQKLQICARRLLEKFDDARAEVLPWFNNRAGQMHSGPEIAVPLTIEDFFSLRQPVEISASETKLDCAAENAALDRYVPFDSKFAFILNCDVFDVDLRIQPCKAH